jgi:hypothetical protein
MTDGIPHIGKLFIGLGIVMIAIGVLFLAAGKIPFIGRLPGDIMVQRKNFTFYFPLATCILLSLLLTFLFWLFGKR